MAANGSKRLLMALNIYKWIQMVQNGSKFFEITQNGWHNNSLFHQKTPKHPEVGFFCKVTNVQTDNATTRLHLPWADSVKSSQKITTFSCSLYFWAKKNLNKNYMEQPKHYSPQI